MFELKDFQRETVDFGNKNPYSIFALQQGLGKSFCALATATETKSNTLIICPAYLRLKWKAEIKKFFPEARISFLENDKQFYRLWDTDFAIISYHYVSKAEILFEWADMVVWDECFHQDTLVETSEGEKKIKDIVVGDLVKNCLGFSRVTDVLNQGPKESYVKVIYNGREIICSLSHPFLTNRGWVGASSLIKGDSLVSSEEAMQILREGFREDGVPEHSSRLSVLFKTMLSEIEGDFVFKKNGVVEPDAKSGIPKKNDRVFKKTRPQTENQGRKRTPPHSPREGNTGEVSRNYMELRNLFKAKTSWLSDKLQTRFGFFKLKTGSRGGREQPLLEIQKASGYQKRQDAGVFRVESVEVYQSSNNGEYRGGDFYDLSVEGHPSFTVNGALVHNCHMLKTMGAKRTEAAHRLVYENSIERVLLLTGTPISNRVYEFYSLIAMCNYNPKIKKSDFLTRFESYVDFANYFSILNEFEVVRYCPKAKKKRRVLVQEWNGYQNIEELRDKYLKDCYIRFTADEVLDLPDSQHIDVPVCYDNNPELLEEFSHFTASGDETSVASNVKAKAALAKVPFTVEYVKNLLEQCEQVVVYTDHVASCLALAEKLGVPGITGQTDMKVRQQLADEFMAGKSRVIVATIGSFSTGIDLFSAHNMVFSDPNWVPGNMEQAQFRIRRIGQKFRCIFHYIIGSYQDEMIYQTLREKIETIKAVI